MTMQTLKRRLAPAKRRPASAGPTGKRRSRKRLSRPKISGRRLLVAAVSVFLLFSVGRSVLPALGIEAPGLSVVRRRRRGRTDRRADDEGAEGADRRPQRGDGARRRRADDHAQPGPGPPRRHGDGQRIRLRPGFRRRGVPGPPANAAPPPKTPPRTPKSAGSRSRWAPRRPASTASYAQLPVPHQDRHAGAGGDAQAPVAATRSPRPMRRSPRAPGRRRCPPWSASPATSST